MTAAFLHENSLLDDMHWSEEHKAYLDFGLHTEDVKLVRPKRRPGQQAQPEMVRAVTGAQPKLQYVPQLGYISEYLEVFLQF